MPHGRRVVIPDDQERKTACTPKGNLSAAGMPPLISTTKEANIEGVT
jgi:hypothetical protein